MRSQAFTRLKWANVTDKSVYKAAMIVPYCYTL